MAVSYPGTIKTFSTKAPGQAIASSHINDLQDEVVAIETQLGTNAGEWQDWTPTDAWAGGTTDFTTVAIVNASYCKVGKLLLVNIAYNISTVGTGNRTQLSLTLPTGTAVEPSSALSGLENVRQAAWLPVGARAWSTNNSVYVYFSTPPTQAGYIFITGVCQLA